MNVRKRFSSLKSKILLATVIPVILTFAFISTFVFISYSAFSEEIAKMKFLETSQKFACNFENQINGAMNYLNIIATDLETRVVTRQTNREALQRTVYSVFANYKIIDGSSIYFEPNMFDDKDTHYANSYFGTKKSGRICWYFYKDGGRITYLPEAMENEIEFEMPHYTMAKEKNKPIYTDPVTYEVEGDNIHMFTLTYPVQNNRGEFIGAVTVDVFLDDLYEELQNEQIYKTGYVGIYNDRSCIIYCPIYDYIGKNRGDEGLSSDLGDLYDSIGFTNIQSMVNGKESLAVIYPIYISGLDSIFYISVTAPLTEIYAESRSMIALFFIVSALVIAAIALLVYFLIRKISAPLDEITRSVDKIAGGEYSARIEGAYTGEFSVVSESVNKMADNIELSLQVLEDAKKQAEQGSRSKSEFLSRMSHEMRTPMNAIIGMTTIGKSAPDTEKKNYAFEKIESASSHLLGVINDVLDMSKIEADKFELSNVEFNFEKMLQKVVNVIDYRVNEKSHHFTVNLDPKIPQRVVGDDQRLAQVITNLLSNAVKFTPELGSISMSVHLMSEEDGICSIKIEVADTGIGISREQQARLFTSFEQAESSTSRKFGGTGLGLAISKKIIEFMSGEIWVDSEPGKGSVFAFIVKLDRAPDESVHYNTAVNPKDIRTLVVDDEAETLEYFIELAHRMGITCDAVSGGKEALDILARDAKYDICFVDWKMPVMNGIELAHEMRARGVSEPVIIMISAYDWNAIEQDARAAGVNGFLSKPLFSSDVMNCINTHIGAKNLPHAESSNPEQAVSFEGFHILLAEDVDINREIVLALLAPTRLEIDCAVNGAEAVKLFSDAPERYDMILMDVQMPEMDGLTATQRIRALDIAKAGEIPIVAMTANVFREDIEKCLEAGMNDHIGKPLDHKELIHIIKKYLFL